MVAPGGMVVIWTGTICGLTSLTTSRATTSKLKPMTSVLRLPGTLRRLAFLPPSGVSFRPLPPAFAALLAVRVLVRALFRVGGHAQVSAPRPLLLPFLVRVPAPASARSAADAPMPTGG